MKIVEKKKADSKNSTVATEKTVLSTIESEFVVRGMYTFETKTFYYFVMEYQSGGDFAHLLREVVLEEAEARPYAAEIVLAVEDLHRSGIIHRDLKPDNILIGADGHIKLTDFGLSEYRLDEIDSHVPHLNEQIESEMKQHFGHGAGKSSSGEGPRVIRGTPDYIAPEVVEGLSHG